MTVTASLKVSPTLDFVANGVAAVLTGVGRYGDGLDARHRGPALCVGGAC